MKQRCPKCYKRVGVVKLWRSLYCIRCVKNELGTEPARALLRHEFGEDPENYTPAVLKTLAARHGVMDANELFAPAGKLSMAETKAREAAAIVCAKLDGVAG